MTKKQVEGEKGGEGGGEKCDSGEVEEEMEEVKEGGAGWRGSGIRDKWMSSHEIAPLASHLLSSGGVSSLSLCVLTLLGGMTYLSIQNKYCTFDLHGVLHILVQKSRYTLCTFSLLQPFILSIMYTYVHICLFCNRTEISSPVCIRGSKDVRYRLS